MFTLLALFPLFELILGDFNLLVLHNNDMHSRFQQADKYLGLCENDTSPNCYGGFARTHSTVVKLKQEAAAKGWPAIFLNAGDTFQGTPYFTYFKWPIVSKFVGMLDLDVMSLGNHEFDDGVASLAPYINNVTVPIVSCNLNISQEPTLYQPNLTPSKVLSVKGVKIGIIGYLTPDTMTLSNTGKVQILDEITSIRAEAAKLLKQNVSILIALGHSGYTKDQQIANEVEEIDVVVGGHSHTFLYSGTPPDVDKPLGPYPTVVTQSSGKKVPVVQAYYGTKYLGYLELTFDDNGNLKSFNGTPILLSGNLPQDPDILKALQPYEEKIYEKINHILGYTDVLLDSNHMACKLGECNVGNLIADAYVDYVARHYNRSQGWTLAAIGLIQAGGIRASINTQTNANHNGSITLGDVMTVMPWGSEVVMTNVSGRVLKQALEFSVARYEDTITGHVSEFLQVSGLRVMYDMNRTVGHRVVSVAALCATCNVPKYQPLIDNQMYGVVMPHYIANGGDGFSMFGNITNSISLDDVDYDVLSQYIQQQGIVYPAVDGRITIIVADSKSAASSLSISWFMLSISFIVRGRHLNFIN